MGICEAAVAEFLPWIEAEMVKGRAAQRDDAAPDDATGSSMIGGGDG
jgi:hypothetical protein